MGGDLRMKPRHSCIHEEDIAELTTAIARFEGKLANGLSARVKLIERMQWWQFGVMVAIIGIVISGLVFLWRDGQDRTQQMLNKLDQHIEQQRHGGVR